MDGEWWRTLETNLRTSPTGSWSTPADERATAFGGPHSNGVNVYDADNGAFLELISQSAAF